MPEIDRIEDHNDKVILDFMLYDSSSYPWSVQEICRELGNPLDAQDAIARLAGTGLVHRCGEFVFPTRTARRANELQMGTV